MILRPSQPWRIKGESARRIVADRRQWSEEVGPCDAELARYDRKLLGFRQQVAGPDQETGVLFSAAAFIKNVSDEILTVSNTALQPYNGATTQVTTVEPVNASGTVICGVELNAVVARMAFPPHPLDGLGFSANVTLARVHYPDTDSRLAQPGRPVGS